MTADWAVKLFKRSVLKQAKYREIVRAIGDTHGRACLDIGGDNGVISYLLRQRGGEWASADLDPVTVAAIRELVGGNVHQIDGRSLPFADASLDLIVIVDFLEHVEHDATFVGEIARVLRPGGLVVANVPHIKRRSLLRRVRESIGLTDEWHGHLRPGYTLEDLSALLGSRFAVETSRTYSGSFSMAIDTALNAAFLKLGGQKAGRSAGKGTVITGDVVRKNQRQFLLLSLLYPVFWAVSRLDHLLFAQQGYMLIVRARRLAAA